VATVAVVGVIAVAVPARFIGEHCFSVRIQPRDRPLEIVRATADVPGYLRTGSSTFLTLPAWYVVYSAEEYAAFVKSRAPSRFPYFAAIGQYWRYYASSCGGTRQRLIGRGSRRPGASSMKNCPGSPGSRPPRATRSSV